MGGGVAKCGERRDIAVVGRARWLSDYPFKGRRQVVKVKVTNRGRSVEGAGGAEGMISLTNVLPCLSPMMPMH